MQEEDKNIQSGEGELNEIFKKEENPAETVKKPSETEKLPKELPVKPKSNKGKERFITFVLDLALNLLIVFGLVYVIQTFIASPFKVYGPSMCSTLNSINNQCLRGYGEYIIVNKLIYKDFFGWHLSEPNRGDIIVFHPPGSENQFYIKRVIGLPNETIKLIDGKVFVFNDEYVTGLELPEEYLNDDNKGKTLPSTNKVTTFDVPEDNFLVMGDNRNASTDSRSCFRDAFQGGCRGEGEYFLPRKNIEGKAWVVLWPLNLIRILEDESYE